jgi:predicted TIM-barrel fold metal-dependent hydrolase
MRNSRFTVRRALSAIAVATIAVSGCAPTQGLAVAQPERYADSHLHIANYAMQGIPLKEVIDRYMGDKIARSTVFGLPFQQKWDLFEHFADDKMPPNYYLGPRAGVYCYSLIDAMVAREYSNLSAKDKARLDPMIVGFNPMDQYGAHHIKRMLLMYPGVFVGVGEFSVHKELIGDKISDDTVRPLGSGAPIPPDVTDTSRNTLYNPSLRTIFDFAAESGLVVNLHSDVYRAEVTHDGKVVRMTPETPHTDGMKHLCKQSPNTTVYWAHTGLGRFVKPAPNHLSVVSEILDACPNWYAELSWDLVQTYIVTPAAGMPALSEWARFVTKYQDRVLWGSDTVLFTRNKIDDKGNVTIGTQMAVAEYLAVKDILNPLWVIVGDVVARKVKFDNHVRVFDAARVKVRAWEASHAKDDIWNLPPK